MTRIEEIAAREQAVTILLDDAVKGQVARYSPAAVIAIEHLVEDTPYLLAQLQEAQEERDNLQRLNTQIHEVNERHVQERDEAIKRAESAEVLLQEVIAMKDTWGAVNEQTLRRIRRHLKIPTEAPEEGS